MTTSQPFASFAAQFDQADEPVGGKWGDCLNQFKSGVETLNKGLQLLNTINDERKKAGFDVDSSADVDSSFDFGSTQSGADHPTFELTHHALNAGQEADAGDEDVGGKFQIIKNAIKYGPYVYEAGKQIYEWGKQANAWDEQSESADRLETDASGAFDRTAIDPLTGSQMSTTSAFYQDAMDVGNESVGLETPAPDFVQLGKSLGWWDVDSSDMVAAEGNQFDGTFKTLSASDLPTAPDADSMADLLPVATDPLA